MRKPELILFDYGNTLVYEPAFDREAGFRAVCMYSGMTLNAAGEKDQRWHIAATNPAQ